MPAHAVLAHEESADEYDRLVSKLLIEQTDSTLPQRWSGRLVGATADQAMAIHRRLEADDAALFAARLQHPEALTLIETNDQRPDIRLALLANPSLPAEAAVKLFSGYTATTRKREDALRRLTPAHRMRCAASTAGLWTKASRALATAVAEHPDGADAALAIAQAAGPDFAAAALTSVLRHAPQSGRVTVSWTRIHEVIVALGRYDADLDRALIEGDFSWTTQDRGSYGEHRITGSVADFADWDGITWAYTRAALLGPLARASKSISLREALTGVVHGPKSVLAPRRYWWGHRTLTSDDLEAAAEAGITASVLQSLRTEQFGCDAGAIAVLAAHSPALAADYLAGSWGMLTTKDKVDLLTGAEFAHLAWTKLLGRGHGHVDGHEILEILDAGIGLETLELAIARAVPNWDLNVRFVDFRPTLLTAPTALLAMPLVSAEPEVWVRILQGRHAEQVNGDIVGNALKAYGRYNADKNARAVALQALESLTLEECCRALRRATAWGDRGYGLFTWAETALDLAHPIIGEAVRLVIVPLVETGTADRALAAIAAKAPLDWGAALEAGSPAALRAAAQTSAEAFADDSRRQELFAQHVKTWNGTLSQLVDTVTAM
jgi:hypothetical protein